MAQQTKRSSPNGKTGARSGKAQSRSNGKAQSRTKSRSTTAKSGSTTAKRSRSTANGRSKSTSKPANSRSRTRRSQASKGPVANAAETAKDGARSAGETVKDAAKSAKVPALIAGAGLVGLAGGAAAAARGGRKRALGVPLPRKSTSKAVTKNLAEASRNVGRFGEGMGSLAAQVSRVSEGVNAATNGRRRSPVEVVLQGLTNRD